MMCKETINWPWVISESFMDTVIIDQYETELSQQPQSQVFNCSHLKLDFEHSSKPGVGKEKA